MSGLAIGWEYLTGYAVATDPASRDRVEWPPHPARVFMAMAAAWFETAPLDDADEAARGEYAAEGQALRWIEGLGDPQMLLPGAPRESQRKAVTIYVPVNDKAGPAAATLQCAPALTRSKQARSFPCRYIGEAPCYMHWPEAGELDGHRQALARLCAKVTRIGHASSLVRMWMADDSELSEIGQGRLERWRPDEAMATAHCRRIDRGFLDALPQQTQIPRIEAFAERVFQIQDADLAARQAKTQGDAEDKKKANKALKEAKARYQEDFGEPYKKSSAPPAHLRPRVGLWTGYRRAERADVNSEAKHTHFDTDLLVLAHVGGPRLPVVSTLAVTDVLRRAVMARSGLQPVPSWVSGHEPDGAKSESDTGHLAYIPLPFVGYEHADGHLLGVALAFPRSVDRPRRGRVLGPLLIKSDGQPREVELNLGRLGVWQLKKRDWAEHRKTLQPETWTALPDGASVWASVTPVVLDRFPKADRVKDRIAWTEEVADIIRTSCERIGLPEPVTIDIGITCWHRGGPRAVTKRRPLRGGGGTDAALGDGFPFHPAKGTNAPRPQMHLWLRFAEPVVGPIVLGAGRYRGYGLFKPWEVKR